MSLSVRSNKCYFLISTFLHYPGSYVANGAKSIRYENKVFQRCLRNCVRAVIVWNWLDFELGSRELGGQQLKRWTDYWHREKIPIPAVFYRQTFHDWSWRESAEKERRRAEGEGQPYLSFEARASFASWSFSIFVFIGQQLIRCVLLREFSFKGTRWISNKRNLKK